MKMKKTIPDIIFDVVNYTIMVLIFVTTLYPFWDLLITSLTPSSYSTAELRFLPPAVSLESYKTVFESKYIWIGFENTIVRTVIGTLLQIFFMVLTAYPLSKKYFPHRGFWTGIIVFTMFFSGGLIPNYLLVDSLGLKDTLWAMILPTLIPTFNMLIVRNFFMGLPDALEESAKIDGANDFVILVKIILPVSIPIMATVLLWQAVYHWNAWFDCLIYINDPAEQVLQLVLRRVIVEGSNQMIDFNADTAQFSVTVESVKAATTMVASLPIIMVYPFVQKHFVKGVMVGSLKG